MEDTGRRGVEARLQCLRNIHTFLDASVILMQQYLTSATITATSGVTTSNVGSQNNTSDSNKTNETVAATNLSTDTRY